MAGLGTPQQNMDEAPAQGQEQYDDFVKKGMRLIYDDKGLDKTLKAISAGGDPVSGVANVVATAVMRIEDSADSKGVTIDPDVIEQGGAELIAQTAELAEEAGIHKFSQQDIDNAYLKAVDLYQASQSSKGKVTPDEAKAQLDIIKQADASGQIDQLLPGISEFAQNAGGQQAPRTRGLGAPNGKP